MTAQFVIDALNRAQRAFETSTDPHAQRHEFRNAMWSYVHHVTAAVLYECVEDPGRAAAAVEWLEGALEDDTAAQWVHGARAAIASGERPSLPFGGA